MCCEEEAQKQYTKHNVGAPRKTKTKTTNIKLYVRVGAGSIIEKAMYSQRMPVRVRDSEWEME